MNRKEPATGLLSFVGAMMGLSTLSTLALSVVEALREGGFGLGETGAAYSALGVWWPPPVDA